MDGGRGESSGPMGFMSIVLKLIEATFVRLKEILGFAPLSYVNEIRQQK